MPVESLTENRRGLTFVAAGLDPAVQVGANFGPMPQLDARDKPGHYKIALYPTHPRFLSLPPKTGTSIPLRYTAALTFGGGSDAYARMVRSRHIPLLRLCFAALIAFAFMLNGMSRVLAASEDGGGGNTVIIAGTVITLCQFDNDADGKDKAHAGHACDQCALRLAPTLPQADIALGVIRFPQVLTLRPISSTEHWAQFTWNAAWPRGPPVA